MLCQRLSLSTDRNGDELQTDVADCDIDSIEHRECCEDEVLPLRQSRWCLSGSDRLSRLPGQLRTNAPCSSAK